VRYASPLYTILLYTNTKSELYDGDDGITLCRTHSCGSTYQRPGMQRKRRAAKRVKRARTRRKKGNRRKRSLSTCTCWRWSPSWGAWPCSTKCRPSPPSTSRPPLASRAGSTRPGSRAGSCRRSWYVAGGAGKRCQVVGGPRAELKASVDALKKIDTTMRSATRLGDAELV
jgi:hypothetical protein